MDDSCMSITQKTKSNLFVLFTLVFFFATSESSANSAQSECVQALTPLEGKYGNFLQSVRNNDSDAVNFLIELYDIDGSQIDRMQALHHAARLGSVDMVELLIQSGADPDFTTFGWQTPAYWIARKTGNHDVATIISKNSRLSYGAVQSNDSYDPSVRDKLSLIYTEFLLNKRNVNANSAVWNLHGRKVTLLEKRLRSSNVTAGSIWAIIKAKDGANVNQLFSDGSTSIEHAIRIDHGEFLILKLLLEAGADPNQLFSDGSTSIEHAIRIDHGEFLVLKQLLEAGADPNVVSHSDRHQGKTMLEIAITTNNIDIILLLKGYGVYVPPFVIDDQLEHYMHNSLHHSYKYKLKQLLEAGADPNLHLSNGRTPIEHVIASELPGGGGYELIELLLEAGADPNVVLGSKGKTILNLAVATQHFDLFQLFEKYGAEIPHRQLVADSL